MSIISTLDYFDSTKYIQTIRLKKKYNITLLNLFPLVLECIIHDYIHDIIVIKIHRINDDEINIYINNQYINCNQISFSYGYYIDPLRVTSILINNLNTDTNIAKIDSNYQMYYYSYSLLLNKYMQLHYNKSEYISTKLIHRIYHNNMTFTPTYHNNTLICRHDYKKELQIKINNHKLFKNIIVIIKYLMKKIDTT